jgi:phosphoglycerate dehydrogenase-like enzyme
VRRLVLDLKANRPVWRIPPEVKPAVEAALGKGWEVVQVETTVSSDGDGGAGSPEAIAAARGAEIYVGYGVPPGVVEAGRGTLRWAHTGTAGVGSYIPLLRNTSIVLTNSAAVHAEPMADWVLAAVAYFARGLDRMVPAQREARWAKEAFTGPDTPMVELADLRVGVFGLGGIGSAVARRTLALGMRTAGIRRRPERGGPPGVAWVGGLTDLLKLAAQSDVLVIAAPHTAETAGVVGPAVLGALPAGAVVVNVSRGSLLDERALLAALDAGRLRGAALDVFGEEPLPSNHPFWRHPGVLVSPHVSAVSRRFWARETALLVDNIRRYLEGQPLRNMVALEAGY